MIFIKYVPKNEVLNYISSKTWYTFDHLKRSFTEGIQNPYSFSQS